MLDNERYFRKNYNISTLTRKSFGLLSKAKNYRMDKLVEDEPSYRVIEMESYVMEFNFRPRMLDTGLD